MDFLSITMISIGLAMDAFAANICKGLCQSYIDIKKTLKIGFCFGFFQMFMPIIGFFLASTFSNQIKAIDHWIAFFLLGLIGLQMIKESKDQYCDTNNKLDSKTLIMLGIATSIDAMAVGISFAFLNVNILTSSITIGLVTLILSSFGFKIGNRLGLRSKQIAEFIGGCILILIGTKILIEHLFF